MEDFVPVIKEEVKEEDTASNLDMSKVTEEINDFSPINLAMAKDGPTPTSGHSGSQTSKHLKVKGQGSSGSKPKVPIANMKRTKSEFVTRDMRRTHAKDMGGGNKEHKVTIEEEKSNSSSDFEDFK